MRFSSFALLGLGFVALSSFQFACGSSNNTTPPGGSSGNTSGNGSSNGNTSSAAGSSSSGSSGGGGTSASQSGSATGVSGNSSTGASSSHSTSSTSPSSGGDGGGPMKWLGTWTASPYFDSGNQPPVSMSNAVLRQVTHVTVGGSTIRVQFSNLTGNGPVTINAAHVALCKATPAVDSTIDTTTDKALAFSGSASVTIMQGQEVWSDPIAFTVPALGNVTITTAFGTVPSQVVGHSGSRTTSYLQPGSTTVNAATMATAPQTFQHWYYISGIDVMADSAAKGAVAIGDSLTDGRGTDNDMNDRWTDVLSAAMQANGATSDVSMMNQGIGATNLIGTTGTAAQARFARDVLGQDGVRYAIVFDGVNDILSSNSTAAQLETAYMDLITRAHGKGLLIYGATITPFGANTMYTAAHESVRQAVNTWIKSGVFDGVIDFDAAITDNGNPPKIQTVYATWAQQDGLHPGPAGYQKMGSSVDLTLFTK